MMYKTLLIIIAELKLATKAELFLILNIEFYVCLFFVCKQLDNITNQYHLEERQMIATFAYY